MSKLTVAEKVGEKTAEFGWISYHGYEYAVKETEGIGSFSVFYRESGELDKDRVQVFQFNNFDADGLISAMQEAVEYYRKNDSTGD
tara:strand:- start:323 stop:580 length:258 start_codon:yes stop_codon:yes gene_type:complete